MASHASITRRTAIKGGLVLAATSHTAVAGDSPSTVHSLIEQHERVLDASHAAWGIIADLMARHFEELPAVKVQTSNLYLGRDDEGKDISKPIYAYSEEGVRKEYAAHIMGALNDKQRQQFEARQAASIAELRTLEAKKKELEDACGITAAVELARSLDAEQKRVMGDLIAAIPLTLAEAAAKAAHLHDAFERDRVEYDEEILLSVIKAMAQISA